MLTIVTGGSKCGKSSYAENILSEFGGKKYYIATMMPFGEDAEAIIKRHHDLRRGKGFESIEKYTDIGSVSIPNGSCVLLECMGNLLANEMFSDGYDPDPVDRICEGIKKLGQSADELVIVTNQVGEDGIAYTEETMQYIRDLGIINRRLSESADRVVEMIYGIPVVLKG